ncbi:MFS transporter [Microbacterium halophytorum]|uniref:MFS transporter n=1 Tax=Microbacterium halophytorum TaxID=2067568 RepID=UPI000CFAB7DB|nr:MFS transporter [Microbacterium halophytorum]
MSHTLSRPRDLRNHLEHARMGFYQWAIVACAVILNANDGYDVAAMSFVSVHVEEEFALSGSELGTVISATLIGMAIGAFAIGRLADIVGRRWTVIGSAVVSTVGMFLAASSTDVLQLGIWRVLTGLGVGGILASITVLTSEFSSRRWRGMAIGLYTAGYGVGAFLGGIAANSLEASYGWRSIFLVGASASVLVVIALIVVVPESVQFLVTRRPAYADRELRRIARRVGFDPERSSLAHMTDLPAEAPKSRLADLFRGRLLLITLLLWLAFFTVMFGFYFVNSWTPRLMVEAGMTAEQGVVIGMALAIGGAVGSVLYGAVAVRFNQESVLIAFLLLSAATIVALVVSTPFLALAFVLGVATGMLVNGCVAGLYSVAPARYGALTRATGVGSALAVGRIGAIFAPIAGGALLDLGWTNVALYSSTAVLLVLGAVAVTVLRRVPEAADA